jgi:AmmeMemoRadiSam system protein A
MKTEHQNLLLQIARDAIFQCLEAGSSGSRFVPQGLENIPELQEERATFVTLTLGGNLRGCIGMLEACRPLAEDVAENARAAAFGDPRFEPLSIEEFENLEIHISVLSPPEELEFESEAELLQQIRPGVDGLILQDCGRRGTFLPSVWEDLPERELFLMHLKMKAGLPGSHWSDTLRVHRYTAEYFPA